LQYDLKRPPPTVNTSATPGRQSAILAVLPGADGIGARVWGPSPDTPWGPKDDHQRGFVRTLGIYLSK